LSSATTNQQNNNNNNNPSSQSTTPTAKGTLVIGGPMKCNWHFDKNGDNFTTENMDEWNAHCHEFGHTMSGTRKCEDCDNLLVYHNIPYHDITPRGSTLVLRCEDCQGKIDSVAEQIKSKGTLKTVGKYKVNEFSNNNAVVNATDSTTANK